MDKEKLEVNIESISRWTNIPIDVVRGYKQISKDEAILRFLSVESQKKLFDRGYTLDPKTEEDKLNRALISLSLGSFRGDFYRTDEGRLWYECNIPNMARVACIADEATRAHKEKFRGQGRQISWSEAINIVSGYRG